MLGADFVKAGVGVEDEREVGVVLVGSDDVAGDGVRVAVVMRVV